MIRGPEVAVGTPKALTPVFCGTKHGAPAMPQMAGDTERAYCVVRVEVTLPWLNTLNASQMNWSLACSVSRILRVTRGSNETVLGG
jgi:hypothetical protein